MSLEILVPGHDPVLDQLLRVGLGLGRLDDLLARFLRTGEGFLPGRDDGFAFGNEHAKESGDETCAGASGERGVRHGG
jgi:hypothetical protein